MDDRFLTDPDEENDSSEEKGWWIATAIVVGAGSLIILGLAIWAIILARRLANIPPPRKCFVSSEDVRKAAESRSFLETIKDRWEGLLKYDCNECTPCRPCEIPRGTEGCPDKPNIPDCIFPNPLRQFRPGKPCPPCPSARIPRTHFR